MLSAAPHSASEIRNPNRTIIRPGLFIEAIGKKHHQLMSITVLLHPRFCLAKLHNINKV